MTLEPNSTHAVAPDERLVSLDVFRGLTMFLLVAGGAGVYRALEGVAPEGTLWSEIAVQFTHHPWNGLRFWDLIQPFFMFIVGVAMPFSFSKRWARGDGWGRTFGHVLYRSGMLLLLGVVLHCTYRGRLVWELWNVLSQLSVTYLVAFLLMRLSSVTQIGFTLVLLAATEAAYRLWPVSGYDEPFVIGRNFGSYVDMLLMGKVNPQGWVAINCVPTAVHTIWGVLAGWALLSRRRPAQKVTLLAVAGLLAVIAGYALDPVTPIIKRISTSSFVIVSGGWSLLALAFFYWLVDLCRVRRVFAFAVAVGTNSIFIYLFSQTIGKTWLREFVGIFTDGFAGRLSEQQFAVVTALVILAIQWWLCYWLYRRRVFIRL